MFLLQQPQTLTRPGAGAIMAGLSSIELVGSTSFVENVAGQYGGEFNAYQTSLIGLFSNIIIPTKDDKQKHRVVGER